jgi:ParB family transcriptional regulator, chromosome partitioning protein
MIMNTKLDRAIAASFGKKDELMEIPLDLIVVVEQLREEKEDKEWTMEDLTDSIGAEGLHQPILLRPSKDGYEVVAGERRFLACKALGFELIPALVREMTDEQAEIAQASENLHHKHFTIIEEAKILARKLKRLGSVEAVLQEVKKPHSWLSKRLALLDLPEQAKRAVIEGITSDIEAVNSLAQIEKKDPVKAKALVDDLAANKNNTADKQNVREKVNAVKAEVKPPKPSKELKKTEAIVKEPEYAYSDDVEKIRDFLLKAFFDILDHGQKAGDVLASWDKETKDQINDHLRTYHEQGLKAKDAARASLLGFRNNEFSDEGWRAFAWIAFQHGAYGNEPFSLLNILGCVKA